jgi:hypothetical protein
MGSQPSTRRDLFGTEGVGEGDDANEIGTRGHSSQGGTANPKSGGTRSNDAGAQARTGNPANVEGREAMPKEREHAPPSSEGGPGAPKRRGK